MLEKYQNWIIGLKLTGFMAIVIIGPATAIAVFISLFFAIIYMFINPEHELDTYYRNIFFLSYVIFSPYYLGKLWHLIQDLEKSLREDPFD